MIDAQTFRDRWRALDPESELVRYPGDVLSRCELSDADRAWLEEVGAACAFKRGALPDLLRR